MRAWAWVLWVVLAGMWAGLVIHLATKPGERLCPPTGDAANVVLRLGQDKGTKEPGVVYMGFPAAKAARDGIDKWLHVYGRCP
jgi:hypothetical protein